MNYMPALHNFTQEIGQGEEDFTGLDLLLEGEKLIVHSNSFEIHSHICLSTNKILKKICWKVCDLVGVTGMI